MNSNNKNIESSTHSGNFGSVSSNESRKTRKESITGSKESLQGHTDKVCKNFC